MKNYVKYNTQEPLPIRNWNGGKFASGYRYYVKDGENWGTVANKDQTSAQQLIQNNFGTLKPEYINWYLRNYVGCDPQRSKDGYNMSFHTVNKQWGGYIFTRNNLQPSMQPPITNGDPMPTPSPYEDPIELPHDPRFFKYGPRLWFGVGAKVGAGWGSKGAERLLMEFSSMWMDPETGEKGTDRMIVSAETERSGWAALKSKDGTDYSGSYGFSGAVIVGVITSCRHPYSIENLESEGPDFSLALGLSGGVKTVAKGAGMAGKAATVGSRMAKTVKAMDEAEDTVGNFKKGFGASWSFLTGEEGKPNVYLFDSPIGAGLEVGVFWAKTRYHLEFKHCTSEGDILPEKIEDPGDWF